MYIKKKLSYDEAVAAHAIQLLGLGMFLPKNVGDNVEPYMEENIVDKDIELKFKEDVKAYMSVIEKQMKKQKKRVMKKKKFMKYNDFMKTKKGGRK